MQPPLKTHAHALLEQNFDGDMGQLEAAIQRHVVHGQSLWDAASSARKSGDAEAEAKALAAYDISVEDSSALENMRAGLVQWEREHGEIGPEDDGLSP